MENFAHMQAEWEPQNMYIAPKKGKDGFKDAQAKETEIFIEDDGLWSESTIEDVLQDDPEKWELLTKSIGIKQ